MVSDGDLSVRRSCAVLNALARTRLNSLARRQRWLSFSSRFPAEDRTVTYDLEGYPEVAVPDLGLVVQAIRDGNCIPFFGAGASMAYAFNGASAAGLASGWEITLALLKASKLATDAQIAALTDPDQSDPQDLRAAMKLHGIDLSKAADFYLYSRSDHRPELDRFLRNEVAKVDGPRPIHTVIAQIQDIYTVLTTNYDCLFEVACASYKRELLKHVHEQFRADTGNWHCPAHLVPPKVILHKMHGCKDRDESMIITRGDYIRYLANWRDPARGMPACVSSRLPASTLLFLGYSLADWNLLTIWEGVVASFPQGGKEQGRSFAVMKSVSAEDRHFFQKRNISVIECDLTHFAIALAREFKLEIPQLGIFIPKPHSSPAGVA